MTNSLVWLYSVNSLAQTFVIGNEQIRRQFTIEEAIAYLIKLIDYYNPDKIIIHSVDFNSEAFSKELKFTIANKIENELIPIEVK